MRPELFVVYRDGADRFNERGERTNVYRTHEQVMRAVEFEAKLYPNSNLTISTFRQLSKPKEETI